MKRAAGFSLVELLLSAAVLGVLLTMLAMFLFSNQRVTTEQVTRASLQNTARLSFARMSDIIAQASYIYPAGQEITLSTGSETKTFTTGAAALALLLPVNTSYCETGPYCAFIYTLEDRSDFTGVLGTDAGTTGFALIERQVWGFNWPRNQVPSKAWGAVDAASPLADSVDVAASSLAATADLATTSYRSTYDDETTFMGSVADDTSALISSVSSDLRLSFQQRGKDLKVERQNSAFARAIPREACSVSGGC